MTTKSMVMMYRPDHFVTAQAHYAATAALWGNASTDQFNEAMNMDWEGAAGEAYKIVSLADHQHVIDGANHADNAAAVAGAAGVKVWSAATAAQYAIGQAEAAQFDVSEGFQLTDRLPSMSDKQRQQRQQQASQHAAAIGEAVNNLVAADTAAAQQVRAAADFSDYHKDTNGHIQMAGHGFKTAPPTDPPMPPYVDEHGTQWASGMAPAPPPLVHNPDGSIKRPQVPSPVAVITPEQKPPDPKDHDCSAREIVDGGAEVLGGGVTTIAGTAGVLAGTAAEAPSLGTSTIPILGGLGGITAGTKMIVDGVDDLSHCTNGDK